MSPRALTPQEVESNKKRLLQVARHLVFTRGIKQVSVDTIVAEAGISKGSFYQYFSSKEELLLALVWEIYTTFLDEAEGIIANSDHENREPRLREFIYSVISDPTKSFFFANHRELEYLIDTAGESTLRDFNHMEIDAFHKLLVMAGRNTEIVEPAVVHNYIHAMYFAACDDAIIKDKLPETIEALLDGLMNYIFQEERNNDS